MMKQRSVAIVGAGFSGATLAVQLLAAGRRAPLIHLIDRSGRFGPGLAYSTANPAHLLNVRAFKMSVTPDDPDSFLDWLRPNPPAPNANFARRASYGAYLECLLRRAKREAGFGAVNLVRDAVVACRPGPDGFRLHLGSGAAIDANAVVLALGNQPCQAPAPFNALDLEDGRFHANPWDGTSLARISPDDDALLLGTGQTMIDAVLTLTATPRTGLITALSRRGLSPRAHTDWTPPTEIGPLPPLPSRLSDALRAVRAEIGAAAARGEPWQHVMDRLRLDAPAIWRGLPREAQLRFLRHLRPWWDVHRHRTAPHIANWIGALRTSGQLRIAAGKIMSASAIEDGALVRYRGRGETRTQTLRVAHVVNCTGPSSDVREARDPLIRQLLAEGMARPHATGIGFDVNAQARVIGAKSAAAEGLYALGPLTQGAYWEATAVPEIRERAAALAQRRLAIAPRRARMALTEAAVILPA